MSLLPVVVPPAAPACAVSLPGRRRARPRIGPGWLLAGLGLAAVARALVAGSAGAASLPAAVVFAVMIGGLSIQAGWRPGRPSLSALMWGLAVAGLVVAGPAVRATGPAPVHGAGGGRLAAWVVVVVAVAASEEALLRGALWGTLEKSWGPAAALVVTTVVFAVIHVPLYGWRAVPLDLAVGLVLGGLRVWTGGAAAPAVAHVVADVLGGWL
jgi:membrane protease YdiL (CAAX protease family)